MTGLKERRQLALYVALGLSAGSGLFLDASTAYASDITIASTDTGYASGINGTEATGNKDGNNVTVGETGAAGPTINGDVVGGYAAAGDTSNNTVTIKSIALDPTKSVYGGKSDTGAAVNNTVVLEAGTPANAYGGYSMGAGAVHHNAVRIAGAAAVHVYGGDTIGTGAALNNTVSIESGTAANLYGGHTVSTGTVRSNIVRVTGGEVTNVYGGQSTSGSTEGNIVTVTGGRVHGKIVAGGSATGTVRNNTVILGDESHKDLSGAQLSGANILGAETAGTASDNTLEIKAKNITVNSVDQFDTYHFHLDDTLRGGDTMLQVVNPGAFDTAGSGVSLKKIAVTGSINTHGLGSITLLKGQADTTDLKFDISVRDLAATFTHELELRTSNTATGNKLFLNYNRFNGSIVTHNGMTVPTSVGVNTELYGGLSRKGNTTTNNELTVTHLAAGLTSAFGGKNEGTLVSDVTRNRLTVTGTTNPSAILGTYAIASVYGGAITNAANGGTVGGLEDGAGNTATVTGGTVDNVFGGRTAGSGAVQGNSAVVAGGTVINVHGGSTAGNGAVQKNAALIAGGTVKTVYGGLSTGSGAVQGNEVVITGGTFGDALNNGSVYGGHTTIGTTSNNTVTLGGADGTYSAHLEHANIYGDNAASAALNGNTLNVRAKDITVKSIQNFDRYQFHLNSSLADGATMLTVNTGGFDRQVKWEDFDVADTSNLIGNPLGKITLMRASAPGQLTFDGYAKRDRIINNDTEYVMETDTGNGTAQAVHLTYAKFHDNTWTYDGTNPAGAAEVFGGISYKDDHTTYNNKLTVTGVPAGNLSAAYGGKTNGAANSTNNTVLIDSTNVNPSSPVQQGQITNVYGGYTASGSGTAEENEAVVHGGKVGTLYGGMAAGANGTAKKNRAIVAYGETTNVYGGSAAAGTQGTASDNHVVISGGTVTGQIAGGRTYNTAQASAGNIVTIGAENGSNGPVNANLAGASLYGTSYYDAGTSAEQVFANDSDRIAGNTLNVTGTGVKAKSIRNFQKLNFKIGSLFKDQDSMLTLSQGGGFGTVTGSADNVRTAWSNVTADTSQLSAERGAGIQGKNTFTLLQTVVPASPDPLYPNDLRFSGYTETAYADIDRVYEKKLHTDASPAQNSTDVDANKVLLELNRYKDGTVTHDGSTSPAEVYGGYSAYDDTKEVNGQHIGHTTENNTLSITGIATGNSLTAYGGYTGGVKGGSVNNHVIVNVQNASPGTLNAVYGGYTKQSSGRVEYNTVALHAGTVNGDVVGGYSDTTPSPNVSVTNYNTVNLYGAAVNGTIFGGAVKSGAGKAANGVGNTLAVHERGAKAADFAGIQNLHFYLPAGTTEDPAAATMLRLTDAAHLTDGKKDLSGINVGVALAGSQPTLHVGDTVSLMKAYKMESGNSTAVEIANVPRVSTAEGMQGVSLRYKFGLRTREALNEANANLTNAGRLSNELVAEVTEVAVNEQTKSLVETRAASMAMLNSSVDLLAENGFRAAEEAISAGLAAAQNPDAQKRMNAAALTNAGNGGQLWAAQSASSTRLHSGSHVDAKGWNLSLGFAKQRAAGRNTITYGPLLEYGRSSYDSYLDDGTHGDGKMSYVGAGVMVKSKNASGGYVEGSIRAGRVKNDYTGNIAGTDVSYDNSSTYYAAHIGFGQEKQLKGGSKVETYAKYFYSHQDGNTTTLSNGDTYDFDAVDSHRIRIGARYTKKLNEDGAFYTGLAYEYEFSGDAGASYQGYSTPSPSLKGGTGILELGYRFTPKKSNVSYGVNLMGMTGKRRGVAGGFQINWAF